MYLPGYKSSFSPHTGDTTGLRSYDQSHKKKPINIVMN